MKKYSIIVVLCCFLIVCSNEPEIRFCETVSDNPSEMWSNSDRSLDYNELETKEFFIPFQWHRSFGSEYYIGKNGFVMLVKGELPLGSINLNAIHVSDDGNREEYCITPNVIKIVDPKANLRAFKIERLLSPEGELGASVLYINDVDVGDYYIFLEKNDEELASCELQIVGESKISIPKEESQEVKSEKEYAKDFTLTTVEGESITLSNLRGRVVLVDFWATWCPPCKKSIPAFKRLYKKFHNREFIVLGISREGKNTLVEFREKEGITYSILIGNRTVSKDYVVDAIPTLFLIDKKGIIRKKQVGWAPELEPGLEKLIEELLNE